MKYPNPKFTGMSMVDPKTISAAIVAYAPSAGSAKASKLSKISNIADLIDFCIEDCRAWGDAVLMGAGSFLKIGSFASEIKAAKGYIKEEVLKYLSGAYPSSASVYDKWHESLCSMLSDSKKHFKNYSAYRKSSLDKFKNKYGFTIGNAQKFLNMLMKDLYACLTIKPTLSPTYEDYFKYCHMPLDSYILRFIDDIRYRETGKIAPRTYTWGNINSYADYIKEQTDIRNFVSKYRACPTITILQTEFVVWPLYK